MIQPQCHDTRPTKKINPPPNSPTLPHPHRPWINTKMPTNYGILSFISRFKFYGQQCWGVKKLNLLVLWYLLAERISCSGEMSMKCFMEHFITLKLNVKDTFRNNSRCRRRGRRHVLNPNIHYFIIINFIWTSLLNTNFLQEMFQVYHTHSALH